MAGTGSPAAGRSRRAGNRSACQAPQARSSCSAPAVTELVSRGRSDIQREAFDGGEPLCLDVGVPIVECLQIKISPSDRPEPLCKVDGSKLLVGPSLIGRRQTIVFSLLIDGQDPKLNRPPQSLIDVQLRPRDAGSEPSAWRFLLALLVAGTGLAAGAATYSAVSAGQRTSVTWGAVGVGVGGFLGAAGFYSSRFHDR